MPEASTACKDAIKLWETAEGKVATDSEEIRLCPIALQQPLISKLDPSLGTLKKCKHLRASTNAIEKIQCLNGMDSLQILSLGRNQIRKLEARNAPGPCHAAGGGRAGLPGRCARGYLAQTARGLGSRPAAGRSSRAHARRNPAPLSHCLAPCR
jgi:Leucine-rich repeat (LRR) protein